MKYKNTKNHIKQILISFKLKYFKFIEQIKKINSVIIKRKERNSKHLFFLLIIISFTVLFIMIGGILYLHHQIKGVFLDIDKTKMFIVKEGESVKMVAENLDSQGIIKNDFYFLVCFELIDKRTNSQTIKAGQYELSPDLNILDVVRKLIAGKTINNTVRILIPEGYNIFQIGELLQKEGLIKDSKEFINKAINEEGKSSEGQLFPDTYEFDNESSVEIIIQKLKDNFKKKISEINQFNQEEDLVRAITKASLLEREVRSYRDKQLVAGIIEKRLKADMPLQIDASVLYAINLEKYTSGEDLTMLRNEHNPVSVTDTKIESDYNTYKIIGLPAGPICNPGIESIRAALNPTKSDFWYYLNTQEGETIFSETYNEHLENKAKYL